MLANTEDRYKRYSVYWAIKCGVWLYIGESDTPGRQPDSLSQPRPIYLFGRKIYVALLIASACASKRYDFLSEKTKRAGEMYLILS